MLGVRTAGEVHGACRVHVAVGAGFIGPVEVVGLDEVRVLEARIAAVGLGLRQHVLLIRRIRAHLHVPGHRRVLQERPRTRVLRRVKILVVLGRQPGVVTVLDHRTRGEDADRRHHGHHGDSDRCTVTHGVLHGGTRRQPRTGGLAGLTQRRLDVLLRHPREHQRDKDDRGADNQALLRPQGRGDALDAGRTVAEDVGEVECRQREQRPVPQVEAVGDPAERLERGGVQQGGDTARAAAVNDGVAGQDDQRRTGERDQRPRAGELVGTVEEEAGTDDQRDTDHARGPARPRQAGRRLLVDQPDTQQATEADLPEAAQRGIVVPALVSAVQMHRVGEARGRRENEQPVQRQGREPHRQLLQQPRQHHDDEQAAQVDLQLRRHRPDVLVEADVASHRRIVLPLVGEVEVLPVGQGRRGVLRGLRPTGPRIDDEARGQCDRDDDEQCGIQTPEQADDRLDQRLTGRVQGVADLRAEEEDTTDEQEHVDARGDPADEDVEDHHEGDGQTAQTVDVPTVGTTRGAGGGAATGTGRSHIGNYRTDHG